MDELSDLLRRLRKDFNMSLRDVQEATGLSHTYLSTLEKGYDPRTKKKRNPSPAVLQTLARFYRVKYDELMQLAGYLEADDCLSSQEKEVTVSGNAELKNQEMKQNQPLINSNSFTTKENSQEDTLTPLRGELDLFTIINNKNWDFCYKDKRLTNEDIEKVKTLLKTLFE